VPGTAKVTWFYEFSDYGWTESLWKAYNSSLTELFAPAEMYASLRMAINGLGVAMPAIRISDDLVYRDSIYDPNSYITGELSDGQFLAQGGNLRPVKGALPAQPPASIFEAVQTRMEGGALYRREMMVRGLPQTVMTNPPGPSFQGAFLQAWNAWTAHVIATWAFRTKSRSGNNALFPVQQVIVGPPAEVIAVGTPVAVGDYVQLLGFRNISGVRGKYLVTSVAGNVIQLAGFAPTSPVTGPKGFIQILSTNGAALQPAYQAITSVRAITQTHRSTGRPSFGPRGRRRAVAR
jgi:hypothetical protein